MLAAAAAASGALVAVLYLVVPPAAGLPRLITILPAAHFVQFLAYLVCAVLAGAGLRQSPSLDHALVPAAFLAYCFSKYTWMLIELADAPALVPAIFLWRFLALGLLLAAIVLPMRRASAGPEVTEVSRAPS